MSWETQLHDLGLVALAGGLGGVLGMEREIAGKPAGLRTHIFVSAGAALLMILGVTITQAFKEQVGENVNVDPTRVIQAIVVGISFLGAGTIIHEGGRREGRMHVEGLTTAASILFAAGIGIATAAHQIMLACGSAVGAVVVLFVIGWAEKALHISRRRFMRKSRTQKKNPSGENSNVAENSP